MKSSSLAIAVASALFASSALASDYQVEAGLSYFDFDGDDSAIAVDATFHFDQVDTSGLPLAEAAFLGRNNNISALYGTFDKADVDIYGLGGEFWIEDFYLSADYQRTDFSVDENDDFAVRAGYMLDDGFLITAGFADGDSFDKTSVLLGSKYVSQLAAGNWINLEGELTINDGDLFIDLAADYFINNSFSAGLRLEESDVDGFKTAVGVGARYFVTSMLSLEAEYMTQDSFDTIGVRAAARF